MDTREQARRSMGDETHEWALVALAQRVALLKRRQSRGHGKPPRTWARSIVTAKTETQKRVGRSLSTVMAGIRALSEVLAQKIIRPAIPDGTGEILRLRVLCDRYRTLALLDQPARQVRRGGLFEPLIEKRGDFFLEVCGVCEPREFVGLKGVPRRGEQKLPRRLGAALGHGDLPGQLSGEYGTYINHSVTYDKRIYVPANLWMTVENAENAARCCSNCSGDYEDPDATAWDEDFEAEEDAAARARED